MSLSPDQIKFIDTYLKNSDIQYIDVRMELVDHVATEVEKQMKVKGITFYDAFKDFMVMYKRDIGRDYERLKKKLQLTSFQRIWPALIKPWMLLLLIAIFFFLENFEFLFTRAFPHSYFVFGSLILVIIVYWVSTFPQKKYRYSSLESLLWPLTISFYILHFVFNFSRNKPLFYEEFPYIINFFVAFYTCFLIAFVIQFFNVRRSYKLKFE
jgi:hypothetical protein